MKVDSLYRNSLYGEVTGSENIPALLHSNTPTPSDGNIPLQPKASQVLGLLKAQRGTSLVEVLVLTLVLVVLITTIYMGTIYADKQIRQNYRHRVATLIATGELERQYVIYIKKNKVLPFTGQDVIIDNTSEVVLKGKLTIKSDRNVEYALTKQYPYTTVTAEVSWIDPSSLKNHKVVVREDFYDVEGKVNQ